MASMLLPKGTQISLQRPFKATRSDTVYPAGAVGLVVEVFESTPDRVSIDMLDGQHVLARALPEDIKIRKAVRVMSLEENVSVFVDIGSADFMNVFLQYRCVVGSRAFGLDTPESDYDRRGWYILPTSYYLGLLPPPERVARDETQEDYWELGHYLKMALAANPNVLETLSTPLVERSTVLSEILLREKSRFYSKYVYQTYQGYVISQFQKLHRTFENTGAYRTKHAMHLLRLLLAGAHLLREGEMLIDVSEHRSLLEAVRDGTFSLAEIEQERERLHRELTKAFVGTKLPDMPDYAWADSFVRNARGFFLPN